MITAIETGTVIVVVVVIEAAVRHRILSYLVVSSSDYDNDNGGGGRRMRTKLDAFVKILRPEGILVSGGDVSPCVNQASSAQIFVWERVFEAGFRHATDPAEQKKDRQSPEVAARVAADTKEAKKLGVTGTPAFFINGRFLSGAQPFAAFKGVIDREIGKPVPANRSHLSQSRKERKGRRFSHGEHREHREHREKDELI